MIKKLPLDEFEQIIRCAPLVSLDLIVRTKAGKILLGLRSDEPAKGYFFVPGGRILKDEHIENAFSRLTAEELGIKLKMKEAYSLGVYQHFYTTNATGTPGFGTHYVVLAYEIILEENVREFPKKQHSEYQWMSTEQALDHPLVHANSKEYLRINFIRNEMQYQLFEKRRMATDTLMWQTPTLLFTAEAFLFSVIASKEACPQFKLVISILGLFIAFAALQLFVKHRSFEKQDSGLLEKFETDNLHKGLALMHRRIPDADDENCEPWCEMARMKSYEIWKTVLLITVVVFLGLTLRCFYIAFLCFKG